MIPNKWSDFDFWSKMGKEYKEKFEVCTLYEKVMELIFII